MSSLKNYNSKKQKKYNKFWERYLTSFQAFFMNDGFERNKLFF